MRKEPSNGSRPLALRFRILERSGKRTRNGQQGFAECRKTTKRNKMKNVDIECQVYYGSDPDKRKNFYKKEMKRLNEIEARLSDSIEECSIHLY